MSTLDSNKHYNQKVFLGKLHQRGWLKCLPNGIPPNSSIQPFTNARLMIVEPMRSIKTNIKL